MHISAGRSEPAFLYEILGEVIKAGATTLNIPDTTGWTLPTEFQVPKGGRSRAKGYGARVLFDFSVQLFQGFGVATKFAVHRRGGVEGRGGAWGVGRRDEAVGIRDNAGAGAWAGQVDGAQTCAGRRRQWSPGGAGQWNLGSAQGGQRAGFCSSIACSAVSLRQLLCKAFSLMRSLDGVLPLTTPAAPCRSASPASSATLLGRRASSSPPTATMTWAWPQPTPWAVGGARAGAGAGRGGGFVGSGWSGWE